MTIASLAPCLEYSSEFVSFPPVWVRQICRSPCPLLRDPISTLLIGRPHRRHSIPSRSSLVVCCSSRFLDDWLRRAVLRSESPTAHMYIHVRRQRRPPTRGATSNMGRTCKWITWSATSSDSSCYVSFSVPVPRVKVYMNTRSCQLMFHM